MKPRIDVRVDDFGIDLETAKKFAARLNHQEKKLPATRRRKWGARVEEGFLVPVHTTGTASRFIFADTTST